MDGRRRLMSADREAKQQLVQIVNELFAHGLLTATGGNVSALAEEPGTLWITPTRLFKGGLAEHDLVRIDAAGTVVEGERVPSIEWRMHFASYTARPGSRGAIHTHAPIATAFGITNQAFPPINTDAVLLRDTAVVPWIMPGTKELADAVGAALARSPGCFLQNHGLMTVGRDLRRAATVASMLEETAKILLYCKQFGGEMTLIPPAGIEQLRALEDFI
jgi:ribulose-5-phosphate 4-epimerase/fuculose-1-phosphate aldolase